METTDMTRFHAKCWIGLALTACLSISANGSAMYPTAGPQWGNDDWNTSNVNQLYDGNTSTSGYFGWTSDALSQLASSSGLFSFQWSLTDAVSAAIHDPVYEAWVVTKPAVTVANGI